MPRGRKVSTSICIRKSFGEVRVKPNPAIPEKTSKRGRVRTRCRRAKPGSLREPRGCGHAKNLQNPWTFSSSMKPGRCRWPMCWPFPPAAQSLVLLGDPSQLDQPLQGTHPPGIEVSALQHVLG